MARNLITRLGASPKKEERFLNRTRLSSRELDDYMLEDVDSYITYEFLPES